MGNTTNRLMLADYLIGNGAGTRNYVTNPSAFRGLASVTDSGASTTRNTSTPLTQISDFQIALDATTDYAEWALNTFDNGLKGQNCEFRGTYKLSLGSGATVQAQVYNGSNKIVTVDLPAESNSNTFSLNFPCGDLSSATTVRFAQTVTTNTSTLNVANLYVGVATNLSNVAQASFYGGLKYTAIANCIWSNSSASWTSFGADTDCNAPSVEGNASAPATKIPAIKFASLPSGRYHIIATGMFQKNNSSNGETSFRFYDGTNPALNQNQIAASAETIANGVITGEFNYTTTQSNITFVIQSIDTNAGAARILTNTAGQNDLYISVYRFPTSSELTVRPDQTPASWSGYHSNDCVFSKTTAAMGDPSADASCTFTERQNRNFGTVTSYLSGSDKLPGIVFTPTRAGRYFVCAGARQNQAGGAGEAYGMRLWDGTTIISQSWTTGVASSNTGYWNTNCGIYNVASAGSAVTLSLQTQSGAAVENGIGGWASNANAVEWSIFQLDAPMPAPVIINSITSNGAGPWRIESADLNCDSASAITQQTGTWITAIGNRSTASCAITIASGIFSTAPMCVLTVKATTVQATAVNVTSSTALTIYGASADYDAYLMCMGAK